MGDLETTEHQITINSKFAPVIMRDDDSGNLALTTRYCILTGGRGSGKSFSLATGLAQVLQHPGRTVLFTRWTMASAKDSIIPEFREKIERLGMGGFNEGAADIEHASGSRILFRGIKTSQGTQTAKLKSLQGVNLWVLDEAEEMPDERTFDVIDLSVRDPRRPCHVILSLNPAMRTHWIYRRWFEGSPVPAGTCGVDRDRQVTFIHTDWRDNHVNLADDFKTLARQCRAANRLRYEHIWLGQWVDQREGALWTWESINDNRVGADDVPDLVQLVIAVDPAVTSGQSSDEAGIVAVGRAVNGHLYVLSDRSLRAAPREWAARAVAEYRLRRASRITYEANQGGDLVADTLRTVDRAVVVKAVRASRGKVTRAEPVASAYAGGMVHHVGTFRELEAEMMTYCGYDSDASPNRLDALVWGCADLLEIDDGTWDESEALGGAIIA
jgi:phage terminase large subunit-like protein